MAHHVAFAGGHDATLPLHREKCYVAVRTGPLGIKWVPPLNVTTHSSHVPRSRLTTLKGGGNFICTVTRTCGSRSINPVVQRHKLFSVEKYCFCKRVDWRLDSPSCFCKSVQRKIEGGGNFIIAVIRTLHVDRTSSTQLSSDIDFLHRVLEMCCCCCKRAA